VQGQQSGAKISPLKSLKSNFSRQTAPENRFFGQFMQVLQLFLSPLLSAESLLNQGFQRYQAAKNVRL
jgi:hypothetical protein